MAIKSNIGGDPQAADFKCEDERISDLRFL